MVKVFLDHREINIKNSVASINIKYNIAKDVGWNYWDIELWDWLGDNYVGELCLFDRPEDDCANNLEEVNLFLSGVGIELVLK